MQRETLIETVRMLEQMRNLIDMDLYMAIYDINGVVLYMYPEDGAKDGIAVGEVYHDTTGKLQEVLRTGNHFHNRIPSGKFGFELEGNIMPVYEADKIAGAVSVVYLPMSQNSLEAQQVALQSIYYLILSMDFENGNCEELYRAYNRNLAQFTFYSYLSFCEQAIAMVHREDMVLCRQMLQPEYMRKELSNKKSISTECRLVLQDTTIHWVELIICKAMAHNESSPKEKYFLMVRDIQEKKAMQERELQKNLELIKELKLANQTLFEKDITDELTGLHNRKGLNYYAKDIFVDAILAQKKLFIFIADLNSLKYINDKFGHGAGDAAIESLGIGIKKLMPKGCVAARTGGDEYAVIGCFDEASEEPEQFVNRLGQHMEQFNEKSGLPYVVEYSYGTCFELPLEKNGLGFYIQAADEKMIAMKHQMKNEMINMDVDVNQEEFRTIDYARNTILVVDDDRFMRHVIRSILEESYEIMEAEDGQMALSKVEESMIGGMELSLIILDVQMPKMDGFQVLDRLKTMKIIGRIPVIMVTASASDDVEAMGYELGVSDFIRKPFNSVIVRHRVENILKILKKQRQLELTLTEKACIVESQARRLKSQSERLKHKGFSNDFRKISQEEVDE